MRFLKLSKTILSLMLFQSVSFFGQNTNQANIYKGFDDSIGQKNIGLNNGTIHINSLRQLNTTHRYFENDSYRLGSVTYEQQTYTDVYLKYDLFKDILIVKIEGQNSTLGINLIQDKTQSFVIDNKQFVNLNYESNNVPTFIKGYYETHTINDQFMLFIKYHKDSLEILTKDGAFYKFEESISYLINYKNTFHIIRESEDLVKLFPDNKENINDFYNMSKDLKRKDENQFMKNLMQYLNNFLLKSKQ